MSIGKTLACIGAAAVIFYTGLSYGKHTGNIPSWVPAEKKITVTYQRISGQAEVFLQQGAADKKSLETFVSQYALSQLADNKQKLLAGQLVEKTDADYKKALVYAILPQLNQKDRSDLLRSEIGSMFSSLYEIFRPQKSKGE